MVLFRSLMLFFKPLMSLRLSIAVTKPQTATPATAAPPMIAIQAPVSNDNVPALLPAGACGTGAGIGPGTLEASSARDGVWAPLLNPRSRSWPFVRTNDSEVLRLRTVTLPLIARTPAVVELMMAML